MGGEPFPGKGGVGRCFIWKRSLSRLQEKGGVGLCFIWEGIVSHLLHQTTHAELLQVHDALLSLSLQAEAGLG